ALWVGGEGLPWLAAFNLTLCLLWIIRGGEILRPALLSTATLAAISAAMWLLIEPEATRFVVACDGFGIVYASLPAFLLAFWCGAWLPGLAARTWRGRAACAMLCAGLGAASFLAIFPECAGGPLGQVDARLNAVWMSHVLEGQPVYALFAGSYWQVPLLM